MSAAPTRTATVALERRRETRMRLLIWLALSCAFAIWLALVAVAAAWVREFFQTSAAPAPAVLEQVGGIVLYREAGARADVSVAQGMQIFDGDEVSTSPGSSATLRAFDGSSLQIYPDARLRVDASTIGRFTPAATRAEFALLTGAMRLSIASAENQAHTMRITTPRGAATFASGEYTLRVTGEAVRISVWNGKATADVGGRSVNVAEGKKLIVRSAEPGDYAVVDVMENVVVNGDFARGYDAWEPWEDREQNRPDVPGHLAIERPGEASAPSVAMRVTRNSERDAHNETGLRQVVNRDVAGSRAVRVEAMVRVDDASLSGGGYSGTEYPLMIRIRAHDRRGGDQVWTHGFYYANSEDRPVQFGEIVPQGTWVKFSADLTQAFSQTATIDSIEVFGAGHTFDASIGAVKLLVD